QPDHRPGHALDRLRDPGRGGALVSGAGRPAADAVVGPGHQLLAALPSQPDVVDERRARHRDIPGGLRVQLPGRRATRRARPAAPEPGLTLTAEVAQDRAALLEQQAADD